MSDLWHVGLVDAPTGRQRYVGCLKGSKADVEKLAEGLAAAVGWSHGQIIGSDECWARAAKESILEL